MQGHASAYLCVKGEALEYGTALGVGNHPKLRHRSALVGSRRKRFTHSDTRSEGVKHEARPPADGIPHSRGVSGLSVSPSLCRANWCGRMGSGRRRDVACWGYRHRQGKHETGPLFGSLHNGGKYVGPEVTATTQLASGRGFARVRCSCASSDRGVFGAWVCACPDVRNHGWL